MKYLGFDVSPLRIGAALVDAGGKRITPINTKTITFPKDAWVTPSMRADAIESLSEFFFPDEEDGADVKGIGLEAVFIGPNKLGSIRAAMALGQVEMACAFEWVIAKQKVMTATQWRSLCGISQGGKQPVMDWALDQCERMYAPPEDQDSADALAIAYAAAKWFADND
jgi:Holliday junction resolvasome RuvABC endonuclease subunit